ncbi:transposase-like protein [Arcanobacterium wilhelmae]|uniref:Transposase-like protein n=1 Tax=Arcanobacterium wilhelmae TaxID=1803177 RepID=A0ABT9NAK9_9ACTO|nr:helix-turn-helix domain-containing protein [Arcanobacterium wilhelmae]MDP9800431.1 transposase-like protein [Arcanobacterium wilhelmae]WFN89853.1 helix-turn-helix domain-containing protein [Arcanobacterium wilhelmae]
MLKHSKISEAERVRLVVLFEAGYGYEAAARIVECGKKSAMHLWDRWRIHGKLALVSKPHKTQYSFEFKLAAVERFLAGESKPAIARDLGLSSPKLLQKWVKAYRDQGENGLHPKPKGRPRGSTTRRVGPVSEVDQLKRRVEWLEMENAYLKALRDFNLSQRES